MALIGGVIRSASTHAPLVFASAQISGNFSSTVSTDGNGVWNADWGYEGVSVNHFGSGFNPVQRNYTRADIVYYPAYGLNGYWAVVELSPAPPPPPTSCFTGDTGILMADGAEVPIEFVSVGDRVRGADGSVSTVVDIERPLLGGRALYGFDGGHPFTTAEHPFLTDRGWSCIDPAQLAAEHAGMHPVTLRPGARMRRLTSARVLVGGGLAVPETVAETHVLSRIDAHVGDPSQTVYNLLLDGSHTYVADGWAVHNKGQH